MLNKIQKTPVYSTPTCLALHSGPLRFSVLPVPVSVVWLAPCIVTHTYMTVEKSLFSFVPAGSLSCASGSMALLFRIHIQAEAGRTFACHSVPSALKDAWHGPQWTSVSLCRLPRYRGVRILGKADLCSHLTDFTHLPDSLVTWWSWLFFICSGARIFYHPSRWDSGASPAVFYSYSPPSATSPCLLLGCITSKDSVEWWVNIYRTGWCVNATCNLGPSRVTLASPWLCSLFFSRMVWITWVTSWGHRNVFLDPGTNQILKVCHSFWTPAGCIFGRGHSI